VLIEVPVMLTVCSFCNRTRHWFPASDKESLNAPSPAMKQGTA
jgi:hypothetical protein